MIRIPALLCTVLVLAGCAAPEGPANQLEKANILPLAIDPDFQIRKVQQWRFDISAPPVQTPSEPAAFDRARATWGAIDYQEQTQRNGNYYHFFWRNRERADVTARLEYRQAGLGNYVMAKERYYPATRGSHKSAFEVTGDEFLENGGVTAWRFLLIVDGRIVALRQSFMWR